MNARVKDIIILEGINGCGKTTIANNETFHRLLLQNEYYQGYDGICVFKCPGDGISEVRELVKNPSNQFDLYTDINLIFADMNELVVKKIYPELIKSKIIILDRCFHSTFVYQQASNYSKDELISKIITDNVINIFGDTLLDRMVTFIFDIPYEISRDRRIKMSSNQSDRFETELDNDFVKKGKQFEEKRKAYLKLALNTGKYEKLVLKDIFVLSGMGDLFHNICNILFYLNVINYVRSTEKLC